MMDAVFRRHMDIIYQYVLEVTPPGRKPIYLPWTLRSWKMLISPMNGMVKEKQKQRDRMDHQRKNYLLESPRYTTASLPSPPPPSQSGG
jgi:hypothetical protein